MSRNSKNIAVYSLWIVGVIIIAHLLIPHDHHSDCSVFNNHELCQNNIFDHHPLKSHGFPIHCHSLNDLTLEKIATVLPVCNGIQSINLFIPGFVNQDIPDSPLSEIRIKDFHKPLLDTYFLRFAPLRAPPSLI